MTSLLDVIPTQRTEGLVNLPVRGEERVDRIDNGNLKVDENTPRVLLVRTQGEPMPDYQLSSHTKPAHPVWVLPAAKPVDTPHFARFVRD